MNFDYASAMVDHISAIFQDLNSAVMLAQSKADVDEYQAIKKTFALTTIKLESEILWLIFRAFPELDRSGVPVPPEDS